MRYLGFTIFAVGLSLALLTPAPAAAQDDEIVVTGTRLSRADSFSDLGGAPGITVVKKGDFLLLGVTIESDARERRERLKEISDTIQAFLDAAKADESIELSIIE